MRAYGRERVSSGLITRQTTIVLRLFLARKKIINALAVGAFTCFCESVVIIGIKKKKKKKKEFNIELRKKKKNRFIF